MLPRGGPLSVHHCLLHQHGAQPRRQDTVRHLFSSQQPHQTQHEGQLSDILAARHRVVVQYGGAEPLHKHALQDPRRHLFSGLPGAPTSFQQLPPQNPTRHRQSEKAQNLGLGREPTRSSPTRNWFLKKPNISQRSEQHADSTAASHRPSTSTNTPVGRGELPVLPPRRDRHSGDAGHPVPQRQPGPAQPAVRAGAVLQARHHEHRGVSTHPHPRRRRGRRTLLRYTVFETSGTLSTDVEEQKGLILIRLFVSKLC